MTIEIKITHFMLFRALLMSIVDATEEDKMVVFQSMSIFLF